MISQQFRYLKPLHCDLLVYDKKKQTFYEHFANFDLDKEMKDSFFSSTHYYTIIAVLSVLITWIYQDFFISLNHDIYASICIISAICGVVAGIITHCILSRQSCQVENKIIADSQIVELEFAMIDTYIKYFKIGFKNSIIAKTMTCLMLLLIFIFISLSQMFLNFPLIIVMLQLCSPILIKPLIYRYCTGYKNIRKYKRNQT